ncbi:uncharacterized protein LOC126232190 [Schistocerca nitens]|uniref:uncharacterized protein LOC126232190 n=1 Tax=Schistocerca nitens TaxID=7011 RepID=UPI002117BA97|nr:uncharacterized protein LOC126232190 [Schistocerca nitens]
MDSKGTNWLKKEKSEVYDESGSLFLADPLKMPSLHIKHDPELKQDLDGTEHDFLEDPLKMPSLHIKHDPELKQDLDGTEHDFLEDDLEISQPNDFIKEDPVLNLEVDETENTVAASIRNASDSTSNIIHVIREITTSPLFYCCRRLKRSFTILRGISFPFMTLVCNNNTNSKHENQNAYIKYYTVI